MANNLHYTNTYNFSNGFNKLSVGNPFIFNTSMKNYNYNYPGGANIAINPKTQIYNQYILEENKTGLRTNPASPPMTNAFNLNSLDVRKEQKYNPYYNPNNYPQRIDNIKDLLNYTYSERIPTYVTKSINPRAQNFYSYQTKNDISKTYDLPLSSRIPITQHNIYTSLIKNNQMVNNNILMNNNPLTENDNKNLKGFIIKNREIISEDKAKEFYKKCDGGIVKSYAYCEDSNSNNRDSMEDKGKSIENFTGDPNKILFCLFDGHGGDVVSKYLQQNFSEFMKKMMPFHNFLEEMQNLFLFTDEKIKNLNVPEQGSTATVAYIEKQNGKKILYVSNVGDTRCILVTKKGVIRLTNDDHVDDPKERERIKNLGGIIYNDRVLGKLILSRCFGDWNIKEFGIIADPHIAQVEITDDILYLIIASDGVWDVIKDEECAEFTETNVNTFDICKSIVAEALARNSSDNISCFVIDF